MCFARYLISVDDHTQVASMLPHSTKHPCIQLQQCPGMRNIMPDGTALAHSLLLLTDTCKRQRLGSWSHPDFGLYHFDTQLIQAKLGCNFWKAARPQRSWDVSFKYCGMMEASPDALDQACDVEPQSCRVCMSTLGTCGLLAACCTRWCIGMRCL